MTEDPGFPVPAALAFSRLRQGVHGSRIIIRLFADTDADALFAAIDGARSHIKPWMDWVDRHQSAADTSDYITRMMLEFTRRENIVLGIFDRADNQTVIGSTGFHSIDWTIPSMEIGYWVIPEAEGQGFFGLLEESCSICMRLTNFLILEFHQAIGLKL